MSEDKQDSHNSDEAVMEPVTEDRTEKKQGGYLGSLLLFVILVGGGVAAWYYQSMWLPQAQQWWANMMPAQEQTDPMAAPPLRDTAEEQLDTESSGESYALLPAIREETPVKEDETTETTEATEADSTPAAPAQLAEKNDETDLSATESVIEEAKDTPAVEDAPATVTVDDSVVAESVAVASKVVEPVVPEAQAATINKPTLSQARQAFWARDMSKAEQLYRELIKDESVAADAWGELGNLYYGHAKWQQAAEAYAETAIRLLEQEQYSQAMFLHYVVRGLDPAQAARIDEKLRAMQAMPQG